MRCVYLVCVCLTLCLLFCIYAFCVYVHKYECAHVHVCVPAVEFQTSEFPVELLLQRGDFEAGGIFESSM